MAVPKSTRAAATRDRVLRESREDQLTRGPDGKVC